MKKTTKFILNNVGLRVAVPPFWAMRKNNHMSEVDSDEFDQIVPDIEFANEQGVRMACPLRVRFGEMKEYVLFPCEPMITVNGGNTIVTRNVKKGSMRATGVNGSVKERWTTNDYSISIDGLIQAKDGKYPSKDVGLIRRMCEAGYVEVLSPILEDFGVSRMVIESWDMPHTSGLENQNFSIKATSDHDYKLLLSKDEWAML